MRYDYDNLMDIKAVKRAIKLNVNRYCFKRARFKMNVIQITIYKHKITQKLFNKTGVFLLSIFSPW